MAINYYPARTGPKSIQQANAIFVGGYGATSTVQVDVTINAVDPDKTVVILNTSMTHYYNVYAELRAWLQDATTVRFEIHNTGSDGSSNDAYASAVVVEYY